MNGHDRALNSISKVLEVLKDLLACHAVTHLLCVNEVIKILQPLVRREWLRNPSSLSKKAQQLSKF
jgi:hypothetical protein